MAMLPLTRDSVPQLSRRVAAALVLVALAALALPTVHLSRAALAHADEEQPTAPVAGASPTTASQPKAAIAQGTPASAPLAAAAKAATVPVAAAPPGSAQFTTPVNARTPTAAPLPAAAATYIPASQPKPHAPAIEFLPPLTASEKRIVAALDRPTEFEFSDTALSNVVDYIKQKHEIEMQVDWSGLPEAGINVSKPVTISVDGISLRSALRLILAKLGATYIVSDEVLLITSHEKADEMIFTRTYPVEDLLTPPTFQPGEGKQGSKYDDAYEPLVKVIMRTIKPESWEQNGGPGDIAAIAAAKSLVISQTYEVHEKVLNLLRSLRAARDPESAAATSSTPPQARAATARPPGATLRVTRGIDTVTGQPVQVVVPESTQPREADSFAPAAAAPPEKVDQTAPQ
jgi:hypothetical protein